MKKGLNLILALLVITCCAMAQQPVMKYDIDITKNPDTFYVALAINKKLSAANNIFQFASTAPGTYQTMNMGRFVSDFKAYDKKGKQIEAEKISVNQYQIGQPKKLARITYKVAETFDTKVDSFPVYPMCGSTIRPTYALLNNHTVAGYLKGWQSVPFSVHIIKPAGWTTGTSLQQAGDAYTAKTYDALIDGPILMGANLSRAGATIAGAAVEIYTYADSAKVTSDSLLKYMTGMLEATGKFLGKLPVDHYTFLYVFMQKAPGITGAWEHSYSSEYIMPVGSRVSSAYLERVVNIASHEFFHIVTPLNIHSEIIESFNFVSPVPSVHLWMYEGVTEWASHILQLRAGLAPLEGGTNSYLETGIQQKIFFDASGRFDSTWSLKKLAEESFTATGAEQYGDIYMKGSLTATYLDIRLLELSDGKAGLRELLLQLMAKYGKSKPISEATFFDDLVAMTYPEVKDFFNRYILGNEPLPHADYLSKIGIQYTREKGSDGKTIYSVKKMDQLTAQQQKLFDAWRVNLPLEGQVKLQ